MRRLYLLFPSIDKAQRAVESLQDMGVKYENIHAVTKDCQDVPGLPTARRIDKRDYHSLEIWVLNINLVFFVLLLGVTFVSIFTLSPVWFGVGLLGSVVTGALALKAAKIPNAHLDEFRDALSHYEILLMVDVNKQRVAEIEREMELRHPEMRIGGVGWSLQALPV